VLSNQVTIEHLGKLAAGKSFDVLHFAGHAQYEEQRQEAGLYVWKEGDGGALEQHLLTLPELEDLLKRMRVGFVYLNCCRAGMQQDALYLKRSRLLGVAHAVLKAGTESVLCYRSAVADGSASSFAVDFYRNLAEYGEVDMALHSARRAAYKRDSKNPIWLSAMLFDQGVRD
jgi:CHAT domain-containing protein